MSGKQFATPSFYRMAIIKKKKDNLNAGLVIPQSILFVSLNSDDCFKEKIILDPQFPLNAK